VYDITSPESFEKAKYWISELQKNASGSIGEQHTVLGERLQLVLFNRQQQQQQHCQYITCIATVVKSPYTVLSCHLVFLPPASLGFG
jgi:hypothetical protein